MDSTVQHREGCIISHLERYGWRSCTDSSVFHCTEILESLSSVNSITITDAPHWGGDVYRQAIIAEMGMLSVPGTSLSGPIQQIFMWPQFREQSVGQRHRDFEEEDLKWRWDHPAEVIDLRNYPRGDCRRAVINAGAGFGKTTLLHALACSLCNDSIFLPALISLDDLVSKKSASIGLPQQYY